MRCDRTGVEIRDPSEGIWDDGEWISWHWINQCIDDQERQQEFPKAPIELIQLFDDLVQSAIQYKEMTGRHLPIFGELGELYAELKYSIKRHRPHAQGSDGRLGNDFVEVKTITPLKGEQKVSVRRSGHFNKLIVVRISADYEFEARLISRTKLGRGKSCQVSWSPLPAERIPDHQSGSGTASLRP